MEAEHPSMFYTHGFPIRVMGLLEPTQLLKGTGAVNPELFISPSQSKS